MNRNERRRRKNKVRLEPHQVATVAQFLRSRRTWAENGVAKCGAHREIDDGLWTDPSVAHWRRVVKVIDWLLSSLNYPVD